MSPGEIVAGFVQASASFENDHSVAREYLTPETAAIWNPATGTRVYEGNLALSAQGGTTTEGSTSVQLQAAEAGSISAQGRYQVSAAAREINIGFRLTQVSGEWRIASPPSGLLLSRADIDRAYRSFNVYFLDPSFSTLVPDPRMIPLDGPGVATSLMRALLTGPTDWLAPAVRTGFPDGTTLTVESVPVIDGIARIDLDPLARLTDDATRAVMSAQMVWTLGQVSTISDIEITAGGATVAGTGSLIATAAGILANLRSQRDATGHRRLPRERHSRGAPVNQWPRFCARWCRPRGTPAQRSCHHPPGRSSGRARRKDTTVVGAHGAG